MSARETSGERDVAALIECARMYVRRDERPTVSLTAQLADALEASRVPVVPPTDAAFDAIMGREASELLTCVRGQLASHPNGSFGPSIAMQWCEVVVHLRSRLAAVEGERDAARRDTDTVNAILASDEATHAAEVVELTQQRDDYRTLWRIRACEQFDACVYSRERGENAHDARCPVARDMKRAALPEGDGGEHGNG